MDSISIPLYLRWQGCFDVKIESYEPIPKHVKNYVCPKSAPTFWILNQNYVLRQQNPCFSLTVMDSGLTRHPEMTRYVHLSQKYHNDPFFNTCQPVNITFNYRNEISVLCKLHRSCRGSLGQYLVADAQRSRKALAQEMLRGVMKLNAARYIHANPTPFEFFVDSQGSIFLPNFDMIMPMQIVLFNPTAIVHYSGFTLSTKKIVKKPKAKKRKVKPPGVVLSLSDQTSLNEAIDTDKFRLFSTVAKQSLATFSISLLCVLVGSFPTLSNHSRTCQGTRICRIPWFQAQINEGTDIKIHTVLCGSIAQILDKFDTALEIVEIERLYLSGLNILKELL